MTKATIRMTMTMMMMTLLMTSALANKKRSRSVIDAEFNEKKSTCYEDIDSGLWGWNCKSSSIMRENCARRCVSASCYDLVYGSDALEEGEVDIRRGRAYKQCFRRESNGEKVSVNSLYDI